MIYCLKTSLQPFNFIVYQKIEDDRYDQLVKFSSYIIAINSAEGVFSCVVSNFRELQHELLSALQDSRMMGIQPTGDLLKHLTRINGRILNILSNIRAYHDFLKTRCERIYGVDFYNKIRAPFRTTYDSNVFYRIGEQFRNYIQHCGLPSEIINLSTDLVNKDERAIFHSISLYLNRDDALSGFDWKKDVVKDIQSLGEKIDVIQLVEMYFCAFVDARFRFMETFSTENAIEINNLRNMLDNEHGRINFVRGSENDYDVGETVPYNIMCEKFVLSRLSLTYLDFNKRNNDISFDPSREFFALFSNAKSYAKALLNSSEMNKSPLHRG